MVKTGTVIRSVVPFVVGLLVGYWYKYYLDGNSSKLKRRKRNDDQEKDDIERILATLMNIQKHIETINQFIETSTGKQSVQRRKLKKLERIDLVDAPDQFVNIELDPESSSAEEEQFFDSVDE